MSLKKFFFAILLTVFCTVVVCSCRRLRSENAEAASLLEDFWNNNHYDVLPTGQVLVVKSEPDLRKGQVPPTDVSSYEVLKQEKLANIVSNQDLTANGNFSWDNFFALSQQGVIRKMMVVRTRAAEDKFRCPDRERAWLGNDTGFCVDMGSGSVEEIVRSQHFQMGTRQFWLIMGNYQWNWSDMEAKFLKARGESTERKRKVMAIAIYEDFSRKWQLSMIDYADRAKPFENQNRFDEMLATAKLVSSSDK